MIRSALDVAEGGNSVVSAWLEVGKKHNNSIINKENRRILDKLVYVLGRNCNQ